MAVGKSGMDHLGIPVGADSCTGCRRIDGLERLVDVGIEIIDQIVHLDVLLRIRKLHDVGRDLDTCIAVVSYPDLAGSTFLGSDEDDAIGCAHAVDGGGRSVLEDGQALDIGAGQEVDVVHEGTVDHVERVGIVADGADTADLH